MLTLEDDPHWDARIAGDMLAAVWADLAPPPHLDIGDWAEAERELSEEETAIPGRFSLDATPVLRGILAAASQPDIRKISSQKSAQIGYTAGIVCNVVGYHIAHKPSVQVAVFPRITSAKDFAHEKLEPMIRSTPTLRRRVSLKSRTGGNSSTRKTYPGGLLKLVGSNSPGDIKSTSARVVIIEEPDDAAADVRGQGDAIKMAEERAKTYPDHLILIGGTPTAKGASSIEAEMLTSDQRRFQIRCPHCDEPHEPHWRNVVIPEHPDAPPREVYGRHRWEDAYYVCPAHGCILTDDERVAAIKRAAALPPLYGWQPTADATGHAGFYLNELMSTFDGSRVPHLARKYLQAKAEMEEGKPEAMVVFWNSTVGEPWEYKGELPEEDELRARALDYAEWTTPAGGLVPVLSVDVQHDRLAVTCWTIGRGEEMWLAYWGEVSGLTVVPGQGAWVELEALITRSVRHATGAALPIAAVGIDCSDGQTSDAAYAFVRKHNRPGRPVLALKGASDDEGKIEVWTRPKAIDPNRTATKASRYGVQMNIVGAAKAKDTILGWAQEGGRVRLTGEGPGRMHWYSTVRPDFYEQLLGELKVPSRANPYKRVWKRRTDRRNEALDCTVYALYLSRALQLHLRKPHSWDIIEMQLRQGVLVPVELHPSMPAGNRAVFPVPTRHRAEDESASEPPMEAPRPPPLAAAVQAPEPALALAEPPASAPADQRATAAAAAFNAMLKARRTRHGRH